MLITSLFKDNYNKIPLLIIFMRKNIIRIAIIVVLILIIPLMGNLFIDGWNWKIGGFIFAFILLFGTGLAIDYASRKIKNPVYLSIVITSIILFLFLLWVEIVTDGVSRTIISFFS